MDLAHFRMLIHKLLNKYPDIVPEEAPLIILYRISVFCIANTDKDSKHTRNIAIRVHFVKNGENSKIHKIDLCGGGL